MKKFLFTLILIFMFIMNANALESDYKINSSLLKSENIANNIKYDFSLLKYYAIVNISSVPKYPKFI